MSEGEKRAIRIKLTDKQKRRLRVEELEERVSRTEGPQLIQ